MKNKRFKYKVFLAFIVLINISIAQNKTILINLSNYNSEAMAYLYKGSGEFGIGTALIDSAQSKAGNIILFYKSNNNEDFLNVKADSSIKCNLEVDKFIKNIFRVFKV